MTRSDLILAEVELAPYTTWKVGGPADYFCLPRDLNELTIALAWADHQKVPVTVLGGGSNVLISDEGIEGLVLCLRELVGVEENVTSEKAEIIAWAGTPKAHLLKFFLQHKLAPALFLCGLPGDVGGGVVMNAGVSEMVVPREFCEIVQWIEILRDGKLMRFNASEIQWTYRHSSGWQPGVVVRAGFAWPMQPDPEIMKKVKAATRVRLTKQPLEMPSCGSVFVNPEGHKSGALIEQSGLKGFTLGGAQVSMKHANFIVNVGGAKASDIDQVISHVRKTVRARFGVELNTEVKYLGRW